jgi:hypothetical protein
MQLFWSRLFTRLCSGTQTAFDSYRILVAGRPHKHQGVVEANLTLDQRHNPDDLVDEELLPYLSSSDDAKSQEQLRRLLDAAKPIVYRIARSMRMGATGTTATFNTQDIFGDVCVRLLQRLRLFKKSPDDHPISNFAGLVATTTTTVFSDLMRGQDRQRRSLSQKIRRLIAANADLETWKDNQGRLVC